LSRAERLLGQATAGRASAERAQVGWLGERDAARAENAALVGLREENKTLRERASAAEGQMNATNEARRAEEQELSGARRREEALAQVRRRLPFLVTHVEHWLDHPGGGTAFPCKDAEGAPPVWRAHCLLMSCVGESAWQYLVEFLGFPNWRTVQAWRKEMLGRLGLTDDIFDGNPDHVTVLAGIPGRGRCATIQAKVTATGLGQVKPLRAAQQMGCPG
jgi:hypothetical protein